MINSEYMTNLTDGLQAATADFFMIGGAMLVVGGSIWAFRKVAGLVGEAHSFKKLKREHATMRMKRDIEYYKNRKQYNSSKRGSYERWEHASKQDGYWQGKSRYGVNRRK